MKHTPAIAEALQIARMPAHKPSLPHVKAHDGIDFQGGLIDAPVHGRTDKIPLNVLSGSYVLPADVVSALGQGNTIAGAAALAHILKDAPHPYDEAGAPYGSAGPYGVPGNAGKRGAGPPGPHPGGPPEPPHNAMQLGAAPPEPPHMARGGEAEERVPIIAAGGEYVVMPHEAAWLGNNDVDRGHRWLDHFVKAVRDKNCKTLASLSGPRKD